MLRIDSTMKKLPSHLAFATLIALSLGASQVRAQDPAVPGASPVPGAAAPAATAPAATPKPKPAPLGDADKRFFKDVSEAILVEQKLAVMGSKKETLGEEGKKAVKTIENDLKRIWERFATLSTAKGAESLLVTEVSKSDASKAERVAKAKDDKFEKELFDELGKEAKKTTRLFESKMLQDPEVKQFASEWAAVVKGHEAAIERAERAAGKKAK